MNKLVYVGFAFLHHQRGHAGYHQIKNYLEYDYVIDTQNFHIHSTKPAKSKLMVLFKYYVLRHFCFGFDAIPWYFFKCLWLAVFKGNMTFHFIYGENLYYNFWFLKVNGCKTVITLHQPYDWFKEKPNWKQRLRDVDHVILVSDKEISLFKQLTGKDNVSFIPHGICSDFYSPDPTRKKEKMVLTVGNWLRDFNFANNVYQELLKRDLYVKVVIVTNPRNSSLISPDSRIQFLSGISDEELRELYRKSSCLFLPLTRYTANNALLEAGAVGCKIIIACNEHDNSYIPESLITQLPLSVNEVTDKIIESFDSSPSNQTISEFVIHHYSWSLIARNTKQLLQEV